MVRIWYYFFLIYNLKYFILYIIFIMVNFIWTTNKYITNPLLLVESIELIFLNNLAYMHALYFLLCNYSFGCYFLVKTCLYSNSLIDTLNYNLLGYWLYLIQANLYSLLDLIILIGNGYKVATLFFLNPFISLLNEKFFVSYSFLTLSDVIKIFELPSIDYFIQIFFTEYIRILLHLEQYPLIKAADIQKQSNASWAFFIKYTTYTLFIILKISLTKTWIRFSYKIFLHKYRYLRTIIFLESKKPLQRWLVLFFLAVMLTIPHIKYMLYLIGKTSYCLWVLLENQASYCIGLWTCLELEFNASKFLKNYIRSFLWLICMFIKEITQTQYVYSLSIYNYIVEYSAHNHHIFILFCFDLFFIVMFFNYLVYRLLYYVFLLFVCLSVCKYIYFYIFCSFFLLSWFVILKVLVNTFNITNQLKRKKLQKI